MKKQTYKLTNNFDEEIKTVNGYDIGNSMFVHKDWKWHLCHKDGKTIQGYFLTRKEAKKAGELFVIALSGNDIDEVSKMGHCETLKNIGMQFRKLIKENKLQVYGG